MSSDISRQRFDPANDFAAVLMQQGRVLLDADWNEWMEILDRHLRAETIDIIGRGVVPKETPQGFEIGFSGGNLTIGAGRIYVDGILAENHGRPPTAGEPTVEFGLENGVAWEWDPVLAELRGTTAVPYNEQPYLPDSTLIAAPPQTGGPHLVYLDVWRREVTWLEDPELVEPAVDVDSTSRWQTAWQVRVLPNAGGTCATPDAQVPDWLDVIRPSAGRLTTDDFDAPGETNPCLIPPTGGYKGLENRLYRVEIHTVDAQGNATFKWARHNASVGSAVLQINGENLVVDLIGRDADLRFKTDDWVEIIDDARELAGLPGFMRNVKNVTDTTRTITIDEALPAGTFPTDAGGAPLPESHTRIRRWDQKGQVRDTSGGVHHNLNAPEPDEAKKGVIPVPAVGTALVLEDGIQLEFSLDPEIAGGRFRAGDYWVFAARTTDASVEKLREAPPRGIHHHYCRLAMVTFPATVEEDCRIFWPPEFGGEGCDCSVCVTADSHAQGTLTIQQAIDQVRTTGGTVCLGPGIYNVPETALRVQGAQSVRIRGQGWLTILAHTGPGPTMVVGGTVGLALERFTVLTARSALGTADLAIENSADVCVQDCYFLQAGPPEQVKAAIGLGGVLLRTRIRDNVIFASAGIANARGTAENDDRPQPLLTLGLYCENNQLICVHHGVRLHGFCLHLGDTLIANNFISEARNGALVATGAVFTEAWGGSRLDVMRNTLRSAGDGIVVGTDDARIDGNDIGPESATRSGNGIVLEAGLLERPLNRLQVTNNRIQQLEQNGIHIRTSIRSGMIKQNQIERVDGGGIIMDEESSAEHLVIENNQLLQVVNLTAESSESQPMLAGIHVVRTRDAEVLNNVLRDVGARASLSRRLAGIQVSVCTRSRIAGNRVVNLGPAAGSLRDADAIAVIGLHENAECRQYRATPGGTPHRIPGQLAMARGAHRADWARAEQQVRPWFLAAGQGKYCRGIADPEPRIHSPAGA